MAWNPFQNRSETYRSFTIGGFGVRYYEADVPIYEIEGLDTDTFGLPPGTRFNGMHLTAKRGPLTRKMEEAKEIESQGLIKHTLGCLFQATFSFFYQPENSAPKMPTRQVTKDTFPLPKLDLVSVVCPKPEHYKRVGIMRFGFFR